eukprot:Opistho-2@41886
MKKNLLKVAIATTLTLGTTALVKAQTFGDNLGNHKATKDLLMQNKQILNTAGMAIGTATFTNSSIALQVDGSDKAILVSRVANNAAIATPVNGMIIYNTTDKKFFLYQGGDNTSAGGAWVTFALAVKESTDGINTTGNDHGYTLTVVGQETILKLSPASKLTPGIVTIDAQEFAGNKTFGDSVFVSKKTTLNADTLTGGLILDAAKVGSGQIDEKFMVVDANGLVKKSVVSPASFGKFSLAVPTGTSAGFLAEGNSSVEFVLTVPGLKTDDGVVVNFSKDDLAAFKGLTILSAVATADNTLTVQIADLRNPAETPGYAAPAFDGKKLIVTRYTTGL